MRYLFGLMLLIQSITVQAFFTNQQDFLPVEKAFQLELLPATENNQALFFWSITPGHYLYQHSITATDAAGKSVTLALPKGIENHDEFFGETEIYRNHLDVPVPSHPDWSPPYSVTWQGCADAGLCYPPQTTVLGAGQKSPATETVAEDLGIAEQLANAGLLVNLGAFFVMGLLLAFTPCMLPMLPILSSVIAGSKPGGWQGARLGVAFVLPMAMVYAILGVVAAQLGNNLTAAMQNPWLLIPFASLFMLLALAQFGLFTLQLPSFIRERLQRTDQKLQGGSLLGAAGLGALSALLVGPCMTAPLAGALLYIGQSGDATTGGLALFSLGLGSGLPLLLAMSFGMRWLPKPGEWMQRINHIFGYALLAAAIFVIRPVLPDTLTLALWAALLLVISLQLFELKPVKWAFLSRYLGLLLGLWSAIMLFGAAGGGSDPLQPLAQLSAGQSNSTAPLNRPTRIADPAQLKQQLNEATQAGQWVILDFYADWCISCKVMEKTVFGQPEVQNAIADMRFLQPDVTNNTQAQQTLLKEYGIIGPPTIVFISPDGEEIRNARITGEVGAAEFLQRLEHAKAGQ